MEEPSLEETLIQIVDDAFGGIQFDQEKWERGKTTFHSEDGKSARVLLPYQAKFYEVLVEARDQMIDAQEFITGMAEHSRNIGVDMGMYDSLKEVDGKNARPYAALDGGIVFIVGDAEQREPTLVVLEEDGDIEIEGYFGRMAGINVGICGEYTSGKVLLTRTTLPSTGIQVYSRNMDQRIVAPDCGIPLEIVDGMLRLDEMSLYHELDW